MSALDDLLNEARNRGLKGSDASGLRELAITYLRKHDMDPLHVILSHLRERLGGSDEAYKIKRQRCPECLADLRLARAVRESGLDVPASISDSEYICVSCQVPGPG